MPPRRNGTQAQVVEGAIPLPQPGEDIAGVMAFAVEHIADPLEVGDLARKAMMSRRTFDRRFRGVSGISAMRWLLQQRVLLAQRLLEESKLPIDEIARRVGFTNGITLRRHFRRYLGASPLQHRIKFRQQRTPCASQARL